MSSGAFGLRQRRQACWARVFTAYRSHQREALILMVVARQRRKTCADFSFLHRHGVTVMTNRPGPAPLSGDSEP